MNFIPDQPKTAKTVIFFEDAKEADGWRGHTTTKSLDTLKSEVMSAISRLGGLVAGFQKGAFSTNNQDRQGFRVHYTIEASNGRLVPGRLDIAALPVRDKFNNRRKEQSLKMALYMLRDAINGMWFFQQLSPGFAPLMPFMLVDSEHTVSQMWVESPVMKNLLPAGDETFIEADIREVKP